MPPRIEAAQESGADLPQPLRFAAGGPEFGHSDPRRPEWHHDPNQIGNALR